ncbi:hypothetical protein BJV78DRAFT_392591 [Lactifluus subvellereus]|nr:hypothetical protein BJV78DRAFT_392591 [Lactifluus subvellereus]
MPPPSTNAPYLIAVWKEVLSSPPPVLAIGKTFCERTQNRTHVEGKKRARPQSSGKPTGVKVDIVANNGHTWIRVNTAKNSRLLAEFREIDSYLTDSDGEDGAGGDGAGPSFAQTEFDNSLLRTGRALLAAARDNPVLGTNTPPEIVLCLTRIDPDATDKGGNDPRIALTIELLRGMGLSIKLGERGPITQLADSAPALSPPPILIPTHQINLDLSILIALVSDLTHAPLPETADAVHERFIPPAAYVEWKRSRLRAKCGGSSDSANASREDIDDAVDSSQHSRALAEQLQQEMQKGILQEIYERLLAGDDPNRAFAPLSQGEPLPVDVEFWTTPEAQDRCLRIVAKIGGPIEKRRAQALFPTSESPAVDSRTSAVDQEAEYWAHSRYPRGFLPLFPIRVFSAPERASPARPPPEGFFDALEATCRELLAAGGAPHPRAPEPEIAGPGENEGEGAGEGGEIQIRRASVVRTNARLTTHTVQSMRCGAARGWTTLTANRASVKAILREVKARGYGVETRSSSRGADEDEARRAAALWIVDPRSLAEGMRSDVDAVSAAPA